MYNISISSRPQVSGKRSEGKETDDFQGGVYEAAVNLEKRDDRRSHEVDAGLSEEADSGSEQEHVSVADLHVRTRALCTDCLTWLLQYNKYQQNGPKEQNIRTGLRFTIESIVLMHYWVSSSTGLEER